MVNDLELLRGYLPGMTVSSFRPARGLVGLAALLFASAALAQTAPAPAPAAATTDLEPTVVQPPPEAPAPAPAPPPPMPPLRPEQAARLLAVLEAAPSHGLPAVDTARLRGRAAEPELIARTLAHARALRGHRLNPTSVSSLWAVAPQPYDAARELQAALMADRLDAWVAALPPPYAGYRSLQGAYGRYRQVADAGGWPTLPSTGVSIRPGVSDPRVPVLRKRLAAEGYVVGSGTGAMYDKELADAVRRFQSRRGLGADGVIGNGALAELNVSAARRADQIAANLERWRWIPRQLPNHRIEVNLPTAMLDYYRDGGIPSTMKVAVGALKHQTPMMTADITSIVLNPPWNVPSSIVKNEIAPRLARDPGYLKRQGLKVVGRYESGLPMLQQAAGPKSALGRVKFDSPNSFAVFLHDTPSRGGFSQTDRLLSHGCVRLEHPLELAGLVLEGAPDWPRERMQAAIDSGKTVRVSLPERLPMYLFYWTSFVDSEGKVYFWDDIYGWDKRLTAALEQAPVQMASR